jgi:hypothetical protein
VEILENKTTKICLFYIITDAVETPKMDVS